jgi:hypothetical protein
VCALRRRQRIQHYLAYNFLLEGLNVYFAYKIALIGLVVVAISIFSWWDRAGHREWSVVEAY